MVKIKLKKKPKKLRRLLDGKSLDGRPKKKNPYRDPDHNVGYASYDRNATFTFENLPHVCEMIRNGASRNDAARFYGSNSSTLRKALRRHPDWELKVEQAEVECKLHHLSRIHMGEKEWKASAWFLSRKWWTEFAQRTPDSYSKEQVMSILLSLGRIISEEIKDADTRSRIMSRVGDLSMTLDSMKTQKAKSDTIHDGDT